jgi:hypothetical protein
VLQGLIKRVFYTNFCNFPFLSRFETKMFTLDLGIFVAVGDVLILRVKI